MNSQNDKSDTPNTPIRYLNTSDLYNINHTVTGGETFIRDIHLLESAVKRPRIELFGQPQFPTVYDKAAALLESLAYHHLFADGNKRTAQMAVDLFLELNGLAFSVDEDAVRAYVLDVAKGDLGTAEIAAWLKNHTQPR